MHTSRLCMVLRRLPGSAAQPTPACPRERAPALAQPGCRCGLRPSASHFAAFLVGFSFGSRLSRRVMAREILDSDLPVFGRDASVFDAIRGNGGDTCVFYAMSCACLIEVPMRPPTSAVASSWASLLAQGAQLVQIWAALLTCNSVSPAENVANGF